MKRLLVVLKIVERCNLNCSYCYFFNGNDQSYKAHPKYFSRELISKVAEFLKEGCMQLGVTHLELIFHGGEPLLFNKKDFDWMCTYFSDYLSSSVSIKYALQTNGTLISQEWAHLFLKHKVSVGVSLDGPEKHNDRYRIDHSGKGSHKAVVKGLNLLNQIYAEHSVGLAGALCVIDPTCSAEEIYQHFSKDLQLKYFDFIIPDYTHDNPPPYPAEAYGKFLIDLFNSWVRDDDSTINIRVLSSSIGRFFGFGSQIYGLGKLKNIEELLPLITISSNGDLSPLDELRSTDPRFRNDRKNISTTSLKEFINLDMFKAIALASETLPKKCTNCCWSAVCEGGGLVGRYSTENKFDNPSIYCNGLIDFFSHITKYLLDNGFPLEELEKNLLLNKSSAAVPVESMANDAI